MSSHSLNIETDKYVEIVLSGGLGNQLFGWAAAFSLSKKMQSKLILNASELIEKSFELSNFDLNDYEFSMTPYKSYSMTNQIMKRLWILSKRKNHYYEKTFKFQELPNKSSFTLHGYFQSYRYFWHELPAIKEQLSTLINPFSDNFLKFQQEHKEESYIAVHVRRGDYTKSNGYHYLLDSSYYIQSIQSVKAKVGDLKVIVFSDDLNSARNVVPMADLFIGINEIHSSAETLLAMSRAKAIIGANSTLSLWAAFLAKTEDHLKIFPITWFGNQEIDTSELMPSSYIRL